MTPNVSVPPELEANSASLRIKTTQLVQVISGDVGIQSLQKKVQKKITTHLFIYLLIFSK